MILLSHPMGNANVRAACDALLRHDMLFEFVTCVGFASESLLARIFKRRAFAVPRAKLRTHPPREITRHLAPRLGLNGLVRHEHGWASADAVGRDLDDFVAARVVRAPGELSGVYSYEDFAEHTFAAARAKALRCIYDLPIAYYETSQRLLREQAHRWPAWEPTLLATRDSAEKLARKKHELQLADVVITPSRFVFDSLPNNIRAERKCVVAEFGSPQLPTLQPNDRSPHKPLRLLFAGAMTQRKGLADLFAAMKLVNSSAVELIVAGSPLLPISFYREQFAAFTYEPPREHSRLLALMQTCDVLVLPSIVEGRALVQQEAMACGLPLLVTRNAGGEDLIEEGETGFLVPPNSPQALAAKIEWFAEHREELPRMSDTARAKATGYTWRDYGEKIIHAIAA